MQEVNIMQGIKEKLSKLNKKTILLKVIIPVLITFALIIAMFIGSKFNIQNEKETQSDEFSRVNEICELATLKCYYHDVAEFEKQSNGLFNYGYKKFWIEYDGTVDVGIDVGKVHIDSPDENGIVKIYVPEARILNVNADPKSITEPISDTGIFTKITIEEQSETFSKTQTTMKNNAASDATILLQAHNNAKKLLEQYVINAGKQTGHQYKVEWIDIQPDEKAQKEQKEN